MGSLAVFGGAVTGIYFLVDNNEETEKIKGKTGPGVQIPSSQSTTTETTSPTTV